VETAAQAFATIETTPSAGYYYAVKAIQPATSITTAEQAATNVYSTAAGLTIAYIEPNTNKSAPNTRLDGPDSDILVSIDKAKYLTNGTIQITIQAGKTLEARVGTFCYVVGFAYTKRATEAQKTKREFADITGRYKVSGITAEGATGVINIEPVDSITIGLISNGKMVPGTDYDVAKTTADISTVDGLLPTVDGYVYPGVAIARGDQWAITGEDSESKAVTGATAAATYVSTGSIRAVKVDTSEITYIVNDAAPFTSGDFIKVINASPASFNFGDKDSSSILPKKVYDINKSYAVTTVTTAPTTISASYITNAQASADGSMTFSYDDADPGFAVGNFVSITGASPSAYNTDFAIITAASNQNKVIAGVVQANITSASATSFDSATVTAQSPATIKLGYDQSSAGFAIGDYVSISGATTESINTGYARVSAISQEDRTISGAVASAQITATSNKIYKITTNGKIEPQNSANADMSRSPYSKAYRVRIFFDIGTNTGIAAGDIVTVTGITPSIWNKATPEVVLEVGTANYDSAMRPFIAIAYPKIPKNSAGSPQYPTSYPETIVKVASCKYTTSTNHNFAIGNELTVSGSSDASFNGSNLIVHSRTANTFTVVRSITGTSSGGAVRIARNSITVEIPTIINVFTTSTLNASGVTVARVPVVKFRTSAVNLFNVGDVVTTESISSSAADVFNLTDQTVVGIETYTAAAGYVRANNGAGNVFVIGSSAQGTYVSGGVSYAERIKNSITVTGVTANSATPALETNRLGVITRIRTNTYTTSVTHPFAVGDYPKVTGTTSHNINASSQQYPVKYATGTTFVTVTSVGSPFSGTAASREYYDSFKVARTTDQVGITAIASNNSGYAQRVPTVTYTSSAHGIIARNRATVTGITPSGFNITDKQVIDGSANVFTVRDEERITAGITYTSGGAISTYLSENNGSFQIEAVGMTPSGVPFVTYINPNSVKDDSTPAQTKAASTRIKIEYANVLPHNMSKISKRGGITVGDSVKVYGTIKNGIITSISQGGEIVTVTTSSHNVLPGDRITIANAGPEYDGKWTVKDAQAAGTSPQTFTYTIPGSTGGSSITSFPGSPTWSVEFESGADISTAVGVTQVERSAAGVVTITTSSAHGISVNQRVKVSILSGTSYEQFSGFQVVATVPNTTTITYATSYESAIAINGVTGNIFLRDGYIVIDTPNASTLYARWPGTQEIPQRSVRATVNAKVGVSDVIDISGTNNNDLNGQYRVVQTQAVTFFGDNLPYSGYFEATPTTAGGTSATEVKQGQFRKKQELATGKLIVAIQGRTIRSAIETITAKTNGQYWVDPYKNIRYKKRKIQNIVANPIFESSSGLASSSGWTIDAGFVIERDGDTGPYDTGYTIHSSGTRRSWEKIKFEPTSARSSKSNAVSISEIQIVVSGSPLVADAIYDEYIDPDASFINDNDASSYWYSTNIQNTIKPSVYLEYDASQDIESYKIYTGELDPSFDPVSWNVYGVDGATEEIIDSQYQYPVTTSRKSIIGTFNLASTSTTKFTLTNGISVSPGKKYWVAARAKAGNISAASVRVSFAFDDSSAKSGEVILSSLTVANEWQKLYTAVTVPSGKYKMYVSGVVSASDANAYFTDFLATEINGAYGFSDSPTADYSAINSSIAIKEYEIPEYSKEGSGVANTVYLYAAIIKADDVSSDGVVSVADGDVDITNTIDNGDIDYSEKMASVATIAVSSNVVTITTTAAHGFYTKDYVVMAFTSSEGTQYNGTYQITRISDTAFSFAKTIANAAIRSDLTDGTARNSYSIRHWSATGATLSPSTSYEISGSHSILVSPTSASASNVNVVYSEGSALEITPGDAYRFSVQTYVPVGQTARAIDMFIYFYKDSSITIIDGTASVSDVMQVSGSWKNISVSGVAPTTAAYAKIEIVIKSTTSTEVHYFDAAEIVDTSYQQIYSYSFTDTKAVWNANGKIIEATETDESVATEEEVSIAAKAFFESNPTGIESINFGFVYNSEPPEVGTVVPFIWRNMQIADVYVIKSVKTKLIGKEVFYEVQITGDSELLGRGLLSGKRTAITVSTDREDGGSRTINPPVYPYIRNGANGAIEINWLHSAGTDNVRYAIWARSVPIGATQYINSQYKLIAPGITAGPAIRTGDTIVWGGTGQAITDLTINKAGTYAFTAYDPRYSYQFVIRASVQNGAVYSQACYIPEPGSPITQYITPPSNIMLSPNTASKYGSMDEYADSIASQSEEGMGGSITSIISTTEDGSSAVFSFDGRGISIYNAQGYTDGLGVTHDVGTRKILESSIDTGVTINADVINTGVLNANVVDVINLNASNITAGTIDAGQIEVINLNADNITSGTITAEQIVVGSGSNTVGISPSYLSASAGYAIWAGSATPSSASPFSVSTDGSVVATNANISGTISASAGNIGGFAINATSISAGVGVSTVALSTTGDYAIYAGSSTASAAPFSVTPGGRVALSDVIIKGGSFSSAAENFIAYAANFANGVITSAKIASLSADKISTGTLDASIVNVTNINATNITSGTISADKISAGTITSIAINAGSGTFQVSSGGNMTATSANIIGTISASAGNIGGFSISPTSITSGSGATAAGIAPASYPFYAGSATASSAPFRVTSAGALTSTNITVTGGPSGGKLISLGSPESFYVTSAGAISAGLPKTGTFTQVSISGLNVTYTGATNTLTTGEYATFSGLTGVDTAYNLANVASVSGTSGSQIVVSKAAKTVYVTGASAAGGTVTYTTENTSNPDTSSYGNTFDTGGHITVTGFVAPYTAYNLSNVRVASVTSTSFTVTNAASAGTVTGITAPSATNTTVSVAAYTPSGTGAWASAGGFRVNTSAVMAARGAVFEPTPGSTSGSGRPAVILAGDDNEGDIAVGGTKTLNIGSTTATESGTGTFTKRMQITSTQVKIPFTTSATSYTTGALTVSGGISINKDIVMGVSATSVQGDIRFKNATGGRIGAFSTTSGNTSIGVYNTDRSAYAPIVASAFFPNQGSVSLSHDGVKFTMNDTLALTGSMTISSNLTVTGTILANGSIEDPSPITTTQTSSAAIWVIPSVGEPYGLRRNSSSRRYKTNIVDADSVVLESARRIMPRHYQSTIEDEAGATRLGFIAEEIHDAGLTHAVGYDQDGKPETIDSVALIAALWHRVGDIEQRLAEIESAD
jgi:hypothetical protein